MTITTQMYYARPAVVYKPLSMLVPGACLMTIVCLYVLLLMRVMTITAHVY